MNDFLTKLSIYDQLGYLAVGGLLYVFLLYDQTYVGLNLNKLASSPFSIAIVVYFLGHMVQAIAQKTGKPTPYIISKSIRKQIGTAVGHVDLSRSQAFQICYLHALTVDKTGHIEIMNARYGLYRGWAIVLTFQAVCCLWIFGYCLLEKTSTYYMLTGCFICAILAWFMANRAARFYQEIGEKTINTFLLTKPGSLLPAVK